MWKQTLCLGTMKDFGIPIEEQIVLFKQIGFDGFFTGYTSMSDIPLYRKTADENQMLYQSIHAPHRTVATMWQPGDAGDETVQLLTDWLHVCADNGVPILVEHAFIGFDTPNPTPDGIRNFEKVAREAEKCGVKLALENTEGKEYLKLLLDHFKGCNSVGFCWDTGHELCYNHGDDMMALHGDQLICTHLNDNLGTKDFDGTITWKDDLHLLPFDGIGDWEDIVRRLNRYNYQGPLTFELKLDNKPNRFENEIYRQMPLPLYLTELYKRACRVAALKERCR